MSQGQGWNGEMEQMTPFKKDWLKQLARLGGYRPPCMSRFEVAVRMGVETPKKRTLPHLGSGWDHVARISRS